MTLYECDICSKTFPRDNNLRKHLIHNHKSDFVNLVTEKLCNICNKTFFSTGELKKHITRTHGNGIKCELCQKMFSHKSNLDKHIQAIHEKARKMNCSICNKEIRD